MACLGRRERKVLRNGRPFRTYASSFFRVEKTYEEDWRRHLRLRREHWHCPPSVESLMMICLYEGFFPFIKKISRPPGQDEVKQSYGDFSLKVMYL